MDAAAWISEHAGPMLDALRAPYVVDVLRSERGGSTSAIGEALCERVAALRATALVVAPHTKGRIKTLFLGSTASHVVHHSHVPVFVLREPCLAPETFAP